MEHALAPFTAFLIMPVFAFFNAGLPLRAETELITLVSIGTFLGLLVGKPVGIAGFVALAVKVGLTRLPVGANWQGMIGIGLLGGIGFTMSLFIAGEAFPAAPDFAAAKIAIFAASVLAGVLGLALLGPRVRTAEQRGTLPSAEAAPLE